MNANIIEIIENLVVFMLDITIPQGSKKLRAEDLLANGIDISKLPPAALSTLGSKRFISPKELAPFQALKRTAERLLIGSGTRFIKGYAVPEAKADELNSAILNLKKQFEDKKDEFLAGYESAIETWIGQNPPEWESMIRSAVDSPVKVARSLSFGFAPVKVSSPKQLAVDDSDHGNAGLEEQTNGLFGQLAHEIRIMAKLSYEESFVGKLSVSRKSLRPISAIREKLSGLAFLDHSISEAIVSIDETLNKLPKSGLIEKTDLDMVAGLVGRRLANFGKALHVEPQQEETETEEFEEFVDSVEVVYDEIADSSLAPAPVFAAQEISAIVWDF